MCGFFEDDLLLKGETSKLLYDSVKDLPVIDYHCHLSDESIALDEQFSNIGSLWLAGDHYKWRAMRMCGIDERYITGDASDKEKFLRFAAIMPKLIGNPLYYWSHLELKNLLGISKPLNESTAENIYQEAGEKLKDLSVRKLLKNYGVKYIATTNNPSDSLLNHGQYDGVTVAPTFRPDAVLALKEDAISALEKAALMEIKSLQDLKTALTKQLDFFVSKGCRITDHGFERFPSVYLSDAEADAVFKNSKRADQSKKEGVFGNLLLFLMKEYQKRGLVVQLHFAVKRNINSYMFGKLGVDSGFDVIAKECDLNDVIAFLDKMTDDERPAIILYSLNPSALRPLCALSGAYRNVYPGAAWWFNDTLAGIRENLAVISEYACLGTHLGMLTDSRAFMSYSRFDFFRRILSSFIGEKVDAGEYCLADAKQLALDISYNNIEKLLKI